MIQNLVCEGRKMTFSKVNNDEFGSGTHAKKTIHGRDKHRIDLPQHRNLQFNQADMYERNDFPTSKPGFFSSICNIKTSPSRKISHSTSGG